MDIKKVVDSDHRRLEAAGEYVKKYGRNILRWTENGLIREDDCYIFVNGDEVAGGVCFGDDTAEEREIYDFAVAETSDPDWPKALQKAVLSAAKPQTKSIGYNLYDDTEQYGEILSIFLRAGFRIVQTKKSYTYECSEPPQADGTLNYRSVTEVGEEAFVSVVRDVTVGTLDKLMAVEAKRVGGDRAAREYVDSLKELDYNPDWWRLGYCGDKLIGLVLPQKFDDVNGGINYIGVLPEFRGNGYGEKLLAEGTRILLENGVRKIFADIDATNHPLASALEQTGYIFSSDESVLTYSI